MRQMTIVLLLLFCTVSSSFGKTTERLEDAGDFHDPFEAAAVRQIEDPLEPLNRAAFWLNDRIYTGILAPLCQAVTPAWQKTLADIDALLDQPLSLGSTDLDFKFRDGGSEVGRLVLQAAMDWLHRVEPEAGRTGEGDFGKTLQAFGIGSGCYLVLPVLGPSNLRDGLARITSLYFEATSETGIVADDNGETDNSPEPSLLGELQAYESICRHTLDPYLFFRDAYSQQLANNGRKRFALHEPRFPASSPDPGSQPSRFFPLIRSLRAADRHGSPQSCRRWPRLTPLRWLRSFPLWTGGGRLFPASL